MPDCHPAYFLQRIGIYLIMSYYFNRTERLGVITLVGLLIIILAGGYFFLPQPKEKGNTPIAVDSLTYWFTEKEPTKKKWEKKEYNSYTEKKQRFESKTTSKHPSQPKKKVNLFLPYDSIKKPRYEKIEKYPAGTKVNLNLADTSELKRIPGIGSYIARLIVNHRTKLGGYHHISQLREINLNDTILSSWFNIDTTAINRINLNKANFNQLQRHPYISYSQARIILNHRKKHGPLRNWKELSLYDEFPKEELKRLLPYICFE